MTTTSEIVDALQSTDMLDNLGHLKNCREANLCACRDLPALVGAAARFLYPQTCTCHRSAVDPCPKHGELRAHAATLRGRLDTDRNDPSRQALYRALQDYERDQILAARAERERIRAQETRDALADAITECRHRLNDFTHDQSNILADAVLEKFDVQMKADQ